MSFRLTITADFDTEEEAEAANSDMQEAMGKHNGDLQIDEIEDLDPPDDHGSLTVGERNPGLADRRF